MNALRLLLGLVCMHIVCFADITNRTTDDSLGDSVTHFPVTYLPTGAWKNESCTTCPIQPDISQTFSGTYTAAMHMPGQPPVSIIIDFTGIALWVFFTLVNNTLTAVNFTLDQSEPISYIGNPIMKTTDFQYKVLVYEKTNLTNSHHTLVISTAQFFPERVYVNFDYAIYTHEDIASELPPNTTTSTDVISSGSAIDSGSVTTSTVVETLSATAQAQAMANTSSTKRAVIAGILGGVGSTIVLLIILYCCIQWRKRLTKDSDVNAQWETPTPFQECPPSSANAAHFDSSIPSSWQDHTSPTPLSKPSTCQRDQAFYNAGPLSQRTPGSSPQPFSNEDVRASIRRRVSFAPFDSGATMRSADQPSRTHSISIRDHAHEGLRRQITTMSSDMDERTYEVVNKFDPRLVAAMQVHITELEQRQSAPARAVTDPSNTRPPDYTS